MPYVNSKRPYKRENELYKSKPDQVKKREERNSARKEMIKEGLAHKGDGKDVDHIDPLALGGKNVRSNIRVIDESTNRSFARQSNHKPKPKKR